MGEIKNNCDEYVKEVLYRINIGAPIDPQMLKKAFCQILSNQDEKFRNIQLGSILTGMMAKGPEVEEIVAMLEASFQLDNYSPSLKEEISLPDGEKLVGSVGSGKKGVKTMNISTPAILIASVAGAYTVKPVSSSTSSVTGSADLLREIGVNIDLPREQTKKLIRDVGFGVFPIESMIPNFNKVYGGRFFAPHALSFGLATLMIPLKTDNLLYGLAHPDIEKSIKVLYEFGVENAMVVSTTHDNIHYLDEMGVYGKTKIVGMKNKKIGDTIYFRPTEELGLPRYTPKDISEGKTPNENIRYCLDVLRGKGEQAREDIISINAGTVLYLAEKAEDLREGFDMAKKIIKTGAPLEKLIEIIEKTNGNKARLHSYLGNN